MSRNVYGMAIVLFPFILLMECSQNDSPVRRGTSGESPLIWHSDNTDFSVAEGLDQFDECRSMIQLTVMHRGDMLASEPFPVQDFSFYRIRFELKCDNVSDVPVRIASSQASIILCLLTAQGSMVRVLMHLTEVNSTRSNACRNLLLLPHRNGLTT